MKTMDPGHYYLLDQYSGADPEETLDSDQSLYFMHRVGPNYPGNQGPVYDGTNCQEPLRALIARALYLNGQFWCVETQITISLLRFALWLFEFRAARIHKIPFWFRVKHIERHRPCRTCGHIICKHQPERFPDCV